MKKSVVWFLLVVLFVSCQSGPPTLFSATTPIPTTLPAILSPAASPTPSPTATVEPSPTAVPTLAPFAAPVDRFEQGRRLGRGVNLGNALEAPNEGEWGMVLQEEYFRLIAEAGFDTIRVPIRWSAHALAELPYTVEETFFQRVDWVIENGLANGLNIVINMHHYDEFFAEPGAHTARFIAIWEQIAARYKDMPDSIYFEPLNEPHDALTQQRWVRILHDTILAIRRIDNRHTLVVSGAVWGGYRGLGTLKLPEGEENYVCSFHFYDPMLFTHQGATWSGTGYQTLDVMWPGPPEAELTPDPEAAKVGWVNTWFSQYNTLPYETNPAGPKPIVQAFDWAVKFAEVPDCPLWLGEFGAYEMADMQSRVNWTTFVRGTAEERGIAWAYWEFGAGFGVYDREAGRWNEALLRALIPDDGQN